MAFLTVSDISSSLPTGYDSSMAQRLLDMVEASMLARNISFNTISQTTRTLDSDLGNRETENLYIGYSLQLNTQKIFLSDYITSVASVSIKSYESSDYINLTNNLDYTTIPHANLDSTYNGFILNKYKISYPNYLEVVAKFGLYVDFTASTNVVTKLFKSCIIEFIRNQLNLRKNYGLITSAEEAGSKVTYSANSLDMSRSVDDSPDLKIIYNYIAC